MSLTKNFNRKYVRELSAYLRNEKSIVCLLKEPSIRCMTYLKIFISFIHKAISDSFVNKSDNHFKQ
jgi:hypothetical protein